MDLEKLHRGQIEALAYQMHRDEVNSYGTACRLVPLSWEGSSKLCRDVWRERAKKFMAEPTGPTLTLASLELYNTDTGVTTRVDGTREKSDGS